MMGAVAVMVNHVMDLSAGDGRPAGEVKGESDVSDQRFLFNVQRMFFLISH
jgi:hypothetical protein